MAAAALIAVCACGEPSVPTVGGAERIAEGGDATWPEVRDMLADGNSEETGLDDLPVDDAALVMAGPAAGDIAVLFDADGMRDDRLVHASIEDETIRDAFLTHVSLGGTGMAADVRAEGDYVIASDGDLGRAMLGEPDPPSKHDQDAKFIMVSRRGFAPVAEHPSPFPVRALDLGEDDSVIVGGSDETRIARINADGTTTHLLGPEGSEAAVVTEPLGPVIARMPIDGDRIAFVAGTDGDTRLYVLDHTAVRPVPADDRGAGPVAGAHEHREPTFADSYPRAALTPLAPSPDGRVLTIGQRPDGDPEIALVDVDTDDVDVLATLDGVEPAVEEPVSAAIVGDDLVFLAQHQLWRLPDVIDTDDA